MLRELVIAVVGGSVVALSAYLLGVKENQINIDHLKRELADIKAIGEKNSDSLVATKLFIAQAHPDRDISKIASVKKLQQLDRAEIVKLAEALPEIKFEPGPGYRIAVLPKDLAELARKHEFSGKDFASYTELANLPFMEVKL